MRPFCIYKDRDGFKCRNYAFTGFDYCRWHMIPRRQDIYESNLNPIFRAFHIILASYFFVGFIISSYQFLLTGKLEILVGVFFYILNFILLSSYSVILSGEYNILWAKTFCISLGVMILSLSIFLVADNILSKGVFSILFGSSFNSLSEPLIFIYDIYLIMFFFGTILLKNITYKLQFAVIFAYIILYSSSTFLEGLPFFDVFIIFLYISYFLNNKYHWVYKIIKYLKS